MLTIQLIDKGLKMVKEYKVLKITILVQKDKGWYVEYKIRDYGLTALDADVVISSPWSVEVVAKGISKGKAVRAILGQNNMSAQHLVVFGDSDNDVSLFQEAGVAVAMGNCSPAACEAGTVIIGKNDTDAIANFLNRVVMTSKCE